MGRPGYPIFELHSGGDRDFSSNEWHSLNSFVARLSGNIPVLNLCKIGAAQLYSER
jgi:hypothetical protein